MQALRRVAGRAGKQVARAVGREAGAEVSTSQATQAGKAWWQAAGGVRGYASEGAPQTRGPVSYLSLGLTLGSGLGLLWWYQHEKEQKLKALTSAGKAVVVGQASIGGPFQLLDQRGRPFSDRDLLGQFALLYFGFCYCPDVCPEELEKVVSAVNLVEKDTGVQLTPVYITVDPERDGVAEVAEYVKEFHPRMVKEAAKAYRVYFNKTGDSADDYLVDHSIITYLLDPEGKFVTFYGKNFTAEEMARSLGQHVRAWQTKHPGWPAKK
eukprot:scaffold20.g7715.t1